MREQLISSHEPGYTKIGPWGGVGGNLQDISTDKPPHRLETVTISCSSVVNSLSFSYMDFNGHTHTVGPWGSPRGNICTIKFDPLEMLQGVHGTVGPFCELPNVITSLTFATNHCRAFRTRRRNSLPCPSRERWLHRGLLWARKVMC
ncbi:salt stress-induced protein-like [Lolium rigidum]|uniref:salt stress-induced protein-like n=1 Tax=Lolium rigidum TaxID=89674 RepID=UPI001F5E205C|nr:salt stress-induced protein-like [Lolium rigidum]